MLFAEATQNAGRVDAQVSEMNTLKAAIEVKIGQHETAIVMSGQSADGAHARLTILLGELDDFSGRAEALISEVKTAGEVTQAQTMEEFKSFRGNTELWYSGIKAHVENNGVDGKSKGGSSGDGKCSTRGDQKDIAVGKLLEDFNKLSFRAGSTRLTSSWRPCMASSMRVLS